MPRQVSTGAIIAALALLLLAGSPDDGHAAPHLVFPWPPGHQHRIYGGNGYNCDTHDRSTETGGPPLYNADYYALDFQFGSVDGSPLEVAATTGGVIVYRANNLDGYGEKMVIDHGGSQYSVYAHLATNSWRPGVEPNAYVTQGQILADAGNSGGNYPVHLHFHMMLGQNALKPEPLTRVSGFDLWGDCSVNSNYPSPYWLPCQSTDYDCDAFEQFRESFVGTVEPGPCAATAQANNEPLPDRWPLDFDDNQPANIGDYLKFNPVMNSFAPGPPYQPRYDLTPNGVINVGDLLNFNPYMNRHCKP